MAKRKQIRDKWKAWRKVQEAATRKRKAIRLTQAEEAKKTEK